MADWTETYRPASLSELRGNNKARDALREWAESWPEEGRAVILHGSPGVGKTSAAYAVANDMGWDAVEVNASDSRTADEVERLVGRAAVNTTLGSGSTRRQVVVVDEADNFHGNVDRGGASAVTRVVKEAEQPVVLVANDLYEMPDWLRKNVETVEFRDVGERSIVPVLRDICRREDVEYEDGALEAIASANSGDLRSAINDLQAVAETTRVLTAEDVVTGERDREEGIFEFLDVVLKEAADAEDALRASYDVDETPDDLIHWIEDNAPKDYAGEELARAYDFLATADRWLGRVRATQNYSYWRYASDNMTAGVAAARDGTKGGWTRYGPPSYWSKLGRTRSTRSTRDAVARKVATDAGTSMATARRELLPFLAAMTHHCKPREVTVAVAAQYDLDEGEVSFLTGSGKSTNKVENVVADARERREAAAVEHSGGAFEGAVRSGEETDPVARQSTSATDDESADATADENAGSEDDDGQAGLDDFF
ncbi:MAG: replication factor C large subunit [Halobacteriaceae archaeon]